MDRDRRERLQAAGCKVGTVVDFLDLPRAEALLPETKKPPAFPSVGWWS